MKSSDMKSTTLIKGPWKDNEEKISHSLHLDVEQRDDDDGGGAVHITPCRAEDCT